MRWAALLLAGGCLWAQANVRSPGHEAYERANALFVEKKLAQCQAALDEALRLDPKLVPALTLQAKLAMVQNRFDTARQSLERAQAADPKSGYVEFLLGLDYYLSNDLRLALPHFEKARALNSSDARAALYLGMTRESLGQIDEALRLYQAAVGLEASAGSPQVDTYLTGARLLLVLGRAAESEDWIRKALKIDPASRDAHFELARWWLNKGDMAAAAKEGEIALSAPGGSVTDTQIHYLLIRAYRKDQPQKAEEHAGALRAMETAPAK